MSRVHQLGFPSCLELCLGAIVLSQFAPEPVQLKVLILLVPSYAPFVARTVLGDRISVLLTQRPNSLCLIQIRMLPISNLVIPSRGLYYPYQKAASPGTGLLASCQRVTWVTKNMVPTTHYEMLERYFHSNHTCSVNRCLQIYS